MASWAASAMAAETRAAKGPKYSPKRPWPWGAPPPPYRPARSASSAAPAQTPATDQTRNQLAAPAGRSNSPGSSQARVTTKERAGRQPAAKRNHETGGRRRALKPSSAHDSGPCPRCPQGKAQAATGPVQKRGGMHKSQSGKGGGALDSPWPELLDGAAAQKVPVRRWPHGGGDTGRLGASPTRLQTGSGHHPRV